MAMIYHITTEQQWNHTQDLYEASLQSEGFIHCSKSDQVIRVANHFFRNTPGLLLLHIETEKLQSPLVYENLEGGEELFPHVYGPIHREAIAHISPFHPGSDGTFNHHAGTLSSLFL